MRYLFIRNDDVGDEFDCNDGRKEVLKELVDICISEKVPILLAVIPARLGVKTKNWLNSMIKKYPKLVSICQHGYGHIDYGCREFGSCRSYDQQYADIKNGLDIMKGAFGKHPRLFVPPHNWYSKNTLRALEKLGFSTISAKYSFYYKRDVIRGFVNFVGRIFGMKAVFGIPVSYQLMKNNGIGEISISIDVVESYRPVKLRDEESILREVEYYGKTGIVGIMIHNWTLDKRGLKMFHNIIIRLKSKGYGFKSVGELEKLVI